MTMLEFAPDILGETIQSASHWDLSGFGVGADPMHFGRVPIGCGVGQRTGATFFVDLVVVHVKVLCINQGTDEYTEGTTVT